MLNPKLDINTLRSEFAKTGRIRAKNVLEPAVAEAVAVGMAQLPDRCSAPPAEAWR